MTVTVTVTVTVDVALTPLSVSNTTDLPLRDERLPVKKGLHLVLEGDPHMFRRDRRADPYEEQLPEHLPRSSVW